MTRAELATEAAGALEGQNTALGTTTDVNWAGTPVGNVDTDANGTAQYTFTYNEGASTHHAHRVPEN